MKLTVAQVLPALVTGGVERGTLEVADELVRRGHRSIVISAGGDLVNDLTDKGSEHVYLTIGRKSPASLRHVFFLRSFCTRGRDYLHG